MTENTDITFKNNSRIHFGLYVSNLERSIAFYKELFQTEPAKVKSDYAKFELDDPSINLALAQTDIQIGTDSRVNHFGIQLKSTESVQAETERFKKLGWITETEEQRTCCYAVQDKVWLTDPDGNRWELFVVTHYDSTQKDDKESYCKEQAEDCCSDKQQDAAKAPCCT
jgi:predicted enzyme related to lactoylglutathione lyase